VVVIVTTETTRASMPENERKTMQQILRADRDPAGEHNVLQVDELRVGDNVEAWHNGKIYHSGRVLHTIPSLGLVTIAPSGGTKARLLDAEVLQIVRASSGPAR
jgi:hypothetical protein